MAVRLRYIHLVICALVFGTTAAQTTKTKNRQDVAPAQSALPSNLWQRVVLIGASATSGMQDPNSSSGTGLTYYGIQPYLDAALLGPHETVRNLGNRLFFFSPEPMGKRQVTGALKVAPSLVVGVDFLFWYCYGAVPEEEERLRRLDRGLAELETLKCPLVVGDIPDASGAAHGMLSPIQIPLRKTIESANKRIKAWAAAREQTAVIELARFMRAAAKNDTIKIQEKQFDQTASLLQADKLHPTARGAAVLALAIAENALRAGGADAQKEASRIDWNLEEVFRRGWAAAEVTERELKEKLQKADSATSGK